MRVDKVQKSNGIRLKVDKGINFPHSNIVMDIITKIETVQGIQNFSEIIMMTAGKHPLSVMIARGDLAVESGYLRLAEYQQEQKLLM